ncbi:MAG: PIG-L family deacetylase [Clostridia bacterium]|nr:PIG-L family deacetylase [Clostridia bacterium]
MEKKAISVYLAPHQDDELTNLGVDLCREVSEGKEVWCLLFTDGSSSFVREFLGNGEKCPLHPGRHVYRMDRAGFALARDREWRESLAAMGLPAERAVVPEGRAVDGSLTKEQAKELLLRFLAGKNDARVTLKTIMPVTGCRQNPDHTNLGKAAEELFREGGADGLELFFEPILTGKNCPEERDLTRVEPENGEQRKKLEKAAAAYGRWDPAHGFFAVGHHSVKGEFDAFAADPHNLKRRVEKT